MKKFGLVILSCFCMAFFGVALMGCDKAAPRSISIQADATLVDVKVKVGDEEFSANNEGQYVVENLSNVKLEFYSNDYAVDFDDVKIEVNGQTYDMLKVKGYDPLRNIEHQYAGRLLLPQVESNLNIQVSGVARAKSTFTLSATNLDNPLVVQKLKQTKINFGLDENYVNLYDFITGEDPSFSKEITRTSGTDTNFNTFKLKFDGTNIFATTKNQATGAITIPNTTAIMVNRGEQFSSSVSKIEWQNDHFAVSMGDIGLQSDYNLVFDFDKLAYQNYTFNLPKRCTSYSVAAADTNFGAESYITISKLHDATDLNSVKLFLDGKQLEKHIIDNNGNVVFKIEKGTTPNISKNAFNSQFDVKVQDVAYTEFLHNLTFGNNPFSATAGTLDADGTFGVFAYGQDGTVQTLAGSTVQFAWAYPYKKDAGYVSPYALNDFDIVLNGNTLFNLADRLKNEMIGLDPASITTLQFAHNNVTVQADYNQETQTFDSIRLIIENCTQDYVLDFANLKTVNKKIAISLGANVPLLNNPSYQLLETEDDLFADEWIEFSSTVHDVQVVAGDRIAVMLTIAGDSGLGENAFTIENDYMISDVQYSVVIGDDYVSSIYIFTISDVIWLNETDFKLIST